MRNLKPGDKVWWWHDSDPGNPEVGPMPYIHPVCGTFVREETEGGKPRLLVSEEIEERGLQGAGDRELVRVRPSWLLSDTELAEWNTAMTDDVAGLEVD